MVVHVARVPSRALVRGVDREVVLRLPGQKRINPDEGVRGAQRRLRRPRLVSKQPSPQPVQELQFTASAQINGKTQTVRIQPADEYNQAFAWDHLLPTHAFDVRIWPNPNAWKNERKPKNRQRAKERPKDRPRNKSPKGAKGGKKK